MNKKGLLIAWGFAFALCAALGFLPEPEGTLRSVLAGLSVLFFLPPALLLYWSARRKDRDTVLLIRNLSALSLGMTLVMLILNLVFAVSSETLGSILHCILVVISAPMICSGYWALSLFLWACLLMVSLKLAKRK